MLFSFTKMHIFGIVFLLAVVLCCIGFRTLFDSRFICEDPEVEVRWRYAPLSEREVSGDEIVGREGEEYAAMWPWTCSYTTKGDNPHESKNAASVYGMDLACYTNSRTSTVTPQIELSKPTEASSRLRDNTDHVVFAFRRGFWEIVGS